MADLGWLLTGGSACERTTAPSPQAVAVTPQVEFLRELLDKQEPTIERIQALIDAQAGEDLHLDYKNALLAAKQTKSKKVGKPEDFNSIIRQYVAGFANSDGGVLIVGVDENTLTDGNRTYAINSIKGRDAHGLGEKVSRILTPIGSDLYPPPLVHVVPHTDGGVVLVIAIDRSYSLAVCTELGEAVYYFRLHDQTLMAPMYLVHDLIVGRRQRPKVQIEVKEKEVEFHASNGNRVLTFGCEFMITNDSFVGMENPQTGIVSWIRGGGPPVPNMISQLVNVQPYSRADAALNNRQYKQVGNASKSGYISPFESYAVWLENVSLPMNMYQMVWEAALYVVCKGQPPLWFQISLHFYLHNRGRADLASAHVSEVLPPDRPQAALWFREQDDEDWRLL